MPGAFLYANRVVPGVTLGGGVFSAPSMPVDNLLDAQPRRRVRIDGAYGLVRVDFLASVSMDGLALISTNLSTAAQIRVRLSTVDTTYVAGDAWDSGTLTCDSGPDANGNVVLIRGAAATGRYLQVEVSDSAANIDLGRLVAGVLWRPGIGMAYGMREGRLVLDRRDRNAFTGAEFPVPAVGNPRTMTFTLQALTNAEVIGQHRTLVRALGAAGDALWIPELTDSRSETNRRAIWGGVNAPGEDALVERSNFSFAQRQFRMVERL